VPIALFVNKQTGELHPDTQALMEQVAQKIEQEGVDAWFSLEPRELLGEDADQYDKVTDTLDVWFDSGVTHACVLDRREALAFPADLYLEGSDQHRGWFQSSLLTSIAKNDQAPYRSVLTHGFVVDAKGQKMSKSRGNVVAPQKVCNSLGADILRLWVSSSDYSGEMAISDEIIKRTADAYRRIRNTARFLLANLNGFDPASNMLQPTEMLALDRWAVDQARLLQEELLEAYESYQFHLIYQKLHNFCSVEMGSFYLDIIKDRQYTTQPDSVARRSAQTAMYHIIEAMARWMAPILSFTAEEIWQEIPGQHGETILFEGWYKELAPLPESFELDAAFWNEVLEIRTQVSRVLENLRNEGNIGSSLDAEVDLYCSEELYHRLAKISDELRFVLITSYARIHPLNERPDTAVDAALSSDESLAINAQASTHGKCSRCWHHREDVGSHADHPELCGRCVDNVEGQGETREYA
jgi:isoleucyl-tRNA synthetase